MKECIFCGKLISQKLNFTNLLKIETEDVCDECFKQLARVCGGCKCCGKKTEEDICEDCRYWENNPKTKIYKIRNYSLFYYNEFAKEMIQKLKFMGDVKILLGFKKIIKAFIKQKHLKNFYLVPVPLYKERLSVRGFNQSYYLAKLINQPLLDIVERKNNDVQSKKTRLERLRFNDDFTLNRDINLENKRILIVDDIYTTGATIHKIAALFFDKKPLEIASFTLFRS